MALHLAEEQYAIQKTRNIEYTQSTLLNHFIRKRAQSPICILVSARGDGKSTSHKITESRELE